MTILDLFAGPGGWSTGLNLLGRRETVGFEWDKAACATARAFGHVRHQADIARLNPTSFATRNNLEGLIASPPCQGFSMAGKGKGRADSARLVAAVGDFLDGDPRATLHASMEDDRSVLALEPLRWVLDLMPAWSTWEQVPAVLPLWEACADVLRSVGYNVWTGLVSAEQYGVPQTRKRAILTASRYGKAAAPAPTHSLYNARRPDQLDGLPKWVSMAEALSWPESVVGFPRRADSGDVLTLGGVEYRARDLRSTGAPAQTVTEKVRSWERWEMGDVRSSKGCVRPASAPAPTMTASMDNGNFRWRPIPANEGDTLEDCAWVENRPAPTIVGSFAPDVVAAPGYRGPGDGPRQKAKGSVRVTVDEAAVLQAFPVDYPWRGSKTAQYRQVGDAVPPLLAAHVLASVGAGRLEVSA